MAEPGPAAQPQDTSRSPVAAITGLSKTFGSTRALRGVDLSVWPGEIHGLVGHNGSGKSTLIKILGGYHAPDPGGELRVRGELTPLPLRHGQQRELGIAFVHQDLGLAESLTVLENLRLGRYQAHGSLGPINWRRERRICQELLDRFKIPVRLDSDVREVRDVDRALIAIARAVGDIEMADRPGLLVLDEPTVYLPSDSVADLFATMRDVAARGHGIIFVAHQLHEVLDVTRNVTVLREGQVAGRLATADASHDLLAELIVGRNIGGLYPEETHVPAGQAALAEFEGLRGGMIASFTGQIKAGEIVGVTGLLGMGWEDLPYLLYGALTPDSGQFRWQGKATPLKRLSPAWSLRSGIALIPANRLRDGVIPTMTVGENVAQAVLRQHRRAGVLRLKEINQQVASTLREFDVRPAAPASPMDTLSGGNQQKALIGKWLQIQPRLLLMHEPTQGVDVRAKQQIFAYISAAAAAGTAVLIASSEYEDLTRICHRVLVVRDGRAGQELSGARLTEPELIKACYGTATQPQ